MGRQLDPADRAQRPCLPATLRNSMNNRQIIPDDINSGHVALQGHGKGKAVRLLVAGDLCMRERTEKRILAQLQTCG